MTRPAMVGPRGNPLGATGHCSIRRCLLSSLDFLLSPADCCASTHFFSTIFRKRCGQRHWPYAVATREPRPLQPPGVCLISLIFRRHADRRLAPRYVSRMVTVTESGEIVIARSLSRSQRRTSPRPPHLRLTPSRCPQRLSLTQPLSRR